MTKRAYIQLLILLLGISFEAMGKGYGHFRPFPLSDYQESIRGYVYYCSEHIKFIALVLIMWITPPQKLDFRTDGMFALIAIFDFVDYLLTGNEIWAGLSFIDGYKAQLPLSMNMVSIVVFTLYAHSQWKMNGSQH